MREEDCLRYIVKWLWPLWYIITKWSLLDPQNKWHSNAIIENLFITFISSFIFWSFTVHTTFKTVKRTTVFTFHKKISNRYLWKSKSKKCFVVGLEYIVAIDQSNQTQRYYIAYIFFIIAKILCIFTGPATIIKDVETSTS